MSKARLATEIGAMLLEPTLNKAGEGLRDWFAEKDLIARGADLFGNIGEVTRAKVLGGLTDEVAAPSVNIADYKRSAFKPSPHEYGGMTKKVRDAMGYEDEAYFRSAPQSTGDWVDQSPETIAGRNFYVTPNQAGREQNSVLIPNTLASSVGIDNLERAKYASEIAGWGASSAALGAAALGMNALMRGSKPRSAYAAAVQDSGGYNPNVEASRASYEYSAKLENLKQQHRRENEMHRQQAFKPGVQQYNSPPMGGYGHYPVPQDPMQMVNNIFSTPTPIYK